MVGSEFQEQDFSAYRQLAFNQLASQDYAAAQSFERALVLARQVHGPSHLSMLTTAGGYAMALESIGRSEEAERLLRASIATADGIRAHGGEPKMAVAVLRYNLATVMFQQAHRLETPKARACCRIPKAYKSRSRQRWLQA